MNSAYLLALQRFREATPFLVPVMCMITDFINSPWPVAFFCVIYWAYNKKLGLWFITSNVLGLYFNGILKITACIARPWVRDTRIAPYENAIPSATGYSFPSGHATQSAVFYGSIALLKKPFNKAVNILITSGALFMAALTMFSRNYLGVHTASDVIAGFAITMVIIVLSRPLVDFITHCTKAQSVAFFIILLLVVALSVIYTAVKSYPVDAINEGAATSQKVLTKDTYYSIGLLAGYAIGVFIEKRFIGFTIDKASRKQLFIAICAVMVLYFFYSFKRYIAGSGGNVAISIASTAFVGIYIFIIVPLVIKRLVNNNKDEQGGNF